MNYKISIKNTLEPIKFNRIEWLLVLIFSIEVLFPGHTAQAADQLHNDLMAGSVITQPGLPIPFTEDNDGEDLDAVFVADPNLVKTKYSTYITVTAYSSTRDQTDSTPFLTASQTYVRDGVVASNYFRYGTKLRFPDIFGDKIFIVEDRMNSRYFKRVDIWMPRREQAVHFGLKRLKVEVLE